jgi:phenylalanyl-tRNA synthetase beta chain
MRVPYDWLKELLPEAPGAEELAEALTRGGLEVEEVREWAPEGGGAGEVVLLTKVTANRGDLLSMVGVARHAAAVLGLPFSAPVTPRGLLGEVVRGAREASSGALTVEIVDPVGCPRYSGVLVTGVTVGASPEGLARRLEAAGVRAINNVVDVTNFVCWELGQPMHAFDFRFLEKGRIIVRRARAGEQVMLIDESVPELTAEDVVIADPLGAVALAGIMGGRDSQVRETTTAVLLEAAHFDPTAIRKSALRLGRSTEASYRFERHVDPNLTLPALARAAAMIVELAGGEVAGAAVDVATREFPRRRVSLRPARCNALLGTELSAEEMSDYLRRVGCEVEEGEARAVEQREGRTHPPAPLPDREGGSEGEASPPAPSPAHGAWACGGGGAEETRLEVGVPTARWDVEREVDLIEEIAIVHGYENIPETIPGRLRGSGRLTREQRIARKAGEVLRECGFNETLSFSMMCPVDLEKLRCAPEAGERRTLALLNPMAADATVMRTTLLPALLGAVANNQRQRVRDVALYEINPVFLAREAGELPEEQPRVAGVLTGSPFTATWNLPAEAATPDFYWLKGLVEQFLAELGVEDCRMERAEEPTFAAGACARVARGEQALGVLGEVAAEVAAAYDIEGAVYAFELNFGAVTAAANLVRQYRALPRFPAALRDVAVAVPEGEEFSAAALAEEIRAAAGEYVESVRPFDRYVDEARLGAGRKSLAFELVFRAPERTLTEAEMDAAMAAVHGRLEALGGEVRRG